MTTNAIISGAECISTPSTYHTIHKENHMTNVIISEEETEDGLYDMADVGLPPSIATPASEMNKAINVIFDGPPAPRAGRFIEVETDNGKSINAGEWIERPDGYWSLRITSLPPEPFPLVTTPAPEVFAPVKLCRFNQAYRPADIFINPKHIVTVRERRSEGKIFTAIETTSGTIEVKESIEVVVRRIT